ncbi:unnamed protein product [Pleuronectes platessa]|uniref:Uncharacterized protein n=1 Tax=Pleuronectes platessa TaxID=8262 RepID=A0A9N7ZE15_PLEPL|nr:unnamed protein product [Pleuronectes platessa]
MPLLGLPGRRAGASSPREGAVSSRRVRPSRGAAPRLGPSHPERDYHPGGGPAHNTRYPHPTGPPWCHSTLRRPLAPLSLFTDPRALVHPRRSDDFPAPRRYRISHHQTLDDPTTSPGFTPSYPTAPATARRPVPPPLIAPRHEIFLYWRPPPQAAAPPVVRRSPRHGYWRYLLRYRLQRPELPVRPTCPSYLVSPRRPGRSLSATPPPQPLCGLALARRCLAASLSPPRRRPAARDYVFPDLRVPLSPTPSPLILRLLPRRFPNNPPP